MYGGGLMYVRVYNNMHVWPGKKNCTILLEYIVWGQLLCVYLRQKNREKYPAEKFKETEVTRERMFHKNFSIITTIF